MIRNIAKVHNINFARNFFGIDINDGVPSSISSACQSLQAFISRITELSGARVAGEVIPAAPISVRVDSAKPWYIQRVVLALDAGVFAAPTQINSSSARLRSSCGARMLSSCAACMLSSDGRYMYFVRSSRSRQASVSRRRACAHIRLPLFGSLGS